MMETELNWWKMETRIQACKTRLKFRSLESNLVAFKSEIKHVYTSVSKQFVKLWTCYCFKHSKQKLILFFLHEQIMTDKQNAAIATQLPDPHAPRCDRGLWRSGDNGINGRCSPPICSPGERETESERASEHGDSRRLFVSSAVTKASLLMLQHADRAISWHSNQLTQAGLVQQHTLHTHDTHTHTKSNHSYNGPVLV